MNQAKLRNIAIIAHVDHGKTTLVDGMLKQTQTFAKHQKENQESTILDNNELEREKGVTILAKNTAVFWHEYKINILDTPGHADFSGEVERVLNMADGCILLVDAAEGVLSQTRFVLRLALELGLVPIVLINKVDRKDQRLEEVENEITDLFLDLATSENQLNFPILYGKGIAGIVGKKIQEQKDYSCEILDSQDLAPLFGTIVEIIPPPRGSIEKPLQLQVTSLDFDEHKGKIVIGRVANGSISAGQMVKVIKADGSSYNNRVIYLFDHYGLKRREITKAEVGEIVALTGIDNPQIGDTLTEPTANVGLPPINISEPTVKIELGVNTSPFCGKEAEFSTSRQINNRLKKELETNVGLRLLPAGSSETLTLVGRGELHLAILIETMRREGYEFAISRPQVVIKNIDGVKMEPWEYVIIDVGQDYTGKITATMSQRLGLLKNMKQTKNGVRFEYEITTANLIGYRNELNTVTSGQAVLHNTFLEFRPLSNRAIWHRGGAMIAHETGQVTAYALEKAQQRGKLFVNPTEAVYTGQIVGIHNRMEDIVMSVTKQKKLTNMRAASADATVVLAPAWKPSLEQFLTMIGEKELLEVTPKNLRLRSVK